MRTLPEIVTAVLGCFIKALIAIHVAFEEVSLKSLPQEQHRCYLHL